jgi:hypothetical protein
MNKTVTLEEFLELLQRERGITLSRAAMLRYLKAGRIEGAIMGRDESGIRRAWAIPRSAVKSFELLKRGNPRLSSNKDS